MTPESLRIEALSMALLRSPIGESNTDVVARARIFLAFLDGSDTPSLNQVPPHPNDEAAPAVGLFSEMHEHEKADTLPWRAQRGLE